MVQSPSDYLDESSPVSVSLEQSTQSLLESMYRYASPLSSRVSLRHAP
jgi:hypothetical protein